MVLGYVDVAMHSPMPATQLVCSQRTLRDGFCAEKDLPHGQMLTASADTSARSQLLRQSTSKPRDKCNLAKN
jgi:hypothetical protein